MRVFLGLRWRGSPGSKGRPQSGRKKLFWLNPKSGMKDWRKKILVWWGKIEHEAVPVVITRNHLQTTPDKYTKKILYSFYCKLKSFEKKIQLYFFAPFWFKFCAWEFGGFGLKVSRMVLFMGVFNGFFENIRRNWEIGKKRREID
jgi:hypothetical protein